MDDIKELLTSFSLEGLKGYINDLERQGQYQEAMQISQKWLYVLTTGHQQTPDNPDYLLYINEIHELIAERLRAAKLHQQAVEHYSQSIHFVQKRIKLVPETNADKRYLWLCLMSLGSYLEELKRYKDAVKEYQSAVRLLNQDVSKHGLNEHNQNYLATSLFKIGWIKELDGVPLDDAVDYYIEAMPLFYQLILNTQEKNYLNLFQICAQKVFSSSAAPPNAITMYDQEQQLITDTNHDIMAVLQTFKTMSQAELREQKLFVIMNVLQHRDFVTQKLFYHRFDIACKVESLCLARSWNDTYRLIEQNKNIISLDAANIALMMAEPESDIQQDLRDISNHLLSCLFDNFDYTFCTIELNGIEAGNLPVEHGLTRVSKLLKMIPDTRRDLRIQVCESSLELLNSAKMPGFTEALGPLFHAYLANDYLHQLHLQGIQKHLPFLAPDIASELKTLMAPLENLSARGTRPINPFNHEYFLHAIKKEVELLNTIPKQNMGRYAVIKTAGVGATAEAKVAREVGSSGKGASLCVIKKLKAENQAHNEERNINNIEEAIKLSFLDTRTLCWLTDVLSIPHECGSDDWIVMPFAQGGSLADWLQEKTLALPEAVYLILTLTRSLALMHQNGFLHLDLKPANILFLFDRNELTQNKEQKEDWYFDGQWTTLIADFGVSILDGFDKSLLSYRGTPAYSAPEQKSGDPVFASDIYSLAVIAVEIIKGKPISAPQLSTGPHFSVDTPIDTNPTQTVADLLDGIPDWLAQILKPCLSLHPEARPSADELLDMFLPHVSVSHDGLNLKSALGASPERAKVVICDAQLKMQLNDLPQWHRDEAPLTQRIVFGMEGFKRAEKLSRFSLGTSSRFSQFLKSYIPQKREIIRLLDSVLGDISDPGSVLCQYAKDDTKDEYIGAGGVYLNQEKVKDVMIPRLLVENGLSLYFRTYTEILEKTAQASDIEHLRPIVETFVTRRLFQSSLTLRFSLAQAVLYCGYLDQATEVISAVLFTDVKPKWLDQITDQTAKQILIQPPFLDVDNALKIPWCDLFRQAMRGKGDYQMSLKASFAELQLADCDKSKLKAIMELLLDLIWLPGTEVLANYYNQVYRQMTGVLIDINLYADIVLSPGIGKAINTVPAENLTQLLAKCRTCDITFMKLKLAVKALITSGQHSSARQLVDATLQMPIIELPLNQSYKLYFQRCLQAGTQPS